MANQRKTTIRIHPLSNSRSRYVAVYSSDFLGATFAVTFPETITGAVALHSFAEMIRKEYGPAVEISVPDGFPLSKDSPVHDIFSEIRQPLLVHEQP